MSLLLKVAIALLIAFVTLAGMALIFSARPTPVLGVDAGSLAHSVKSAGAGCSENSDGTWVCVLEGDKADTRYSVDVRWDGCWEATRYRGPVTEFTPDSKSGCIDIWDHLRLENAFD